MLRAIVSTVLLACLCSISCALAAQPTPAHRLTETERAAIQYLKGKLDADGRGALDFADERSVQAYSTLLRLHGFDSKSRPYLFASLTAAQANAKQQRAGVIGAARECKLPIDGKGPQTYREVLDVVSNADFSTVQGRALDSINMPNPTLGSAVDDGRPTYVVDTLDVYDEDVETLLTSGVDEGYVDGPTGLDPRAQLVKTSVGANPTKHPVVLFGSYYYRTATGPHGPCMLLLPWAHFTPKEMKLDAPTRRAGSTNPPGSPVVICLNRKGTAVSDCDQGPWPHAGGTPIQVLLNVAGSVTYNDPIATSKDADFVEGELAVMPRNVGGACVLSAKSFADHFAIAHDDPTKMTFKWADPPANFGDVCWDKVQSGHEWNFVLSTHVTTLNKSGAPTYPVLAVFMSPLGGNDSGGIEGDPNLLPVSVLKMEWGCVKKGTLVEMADGGTKAIEDIAPDDVVLGQGGQHFKVTNLIQGDDTDFIEIDAGARHVALTPGHPVAVKGRGFVQAKALKDGDVLVVSAASGKPASGNSAFVAASHVEQRKAAAKVYNLTLTRLDATSNAGVKPSFFAGGILVGDTSEQNELTAQDDARTGALPPLHLSGPEERVDYENWLKSRQAGNRKGSTLTGQ